MLTEKDRAAIEKKGISAAEIERQIRLFERGVDYVKLIKPATSGEGIDVLDEKQEQTLIDLYETGMEDKTVLKFVPASGAASRMFKDLYNAMEDLAKNGSPDIIENNKSLYDFFRQLEEYPFYEDLKKAIEPNDKSISSLIEDKKYQTVLEFILTERGINYGSLPKGLLKFHQYPEGARTALEEHYEEASLYLTDPKAAVNLHFTVSPEHLSLFSNLTDVLNEKYRNSQGLLFNVSFSVQKPSTDTLAVDLQNKPFRSEDESLLFRPGGHGALIENLNELDEDMVFIGNIDNVCPDHMKDLKIRYKKILGGFLLKKTERIHNILNRIEKGERGEALRNHIMEVVYEISPESAQELKTLHNDLFNENAYKFLNKPLRVCGMVQNIGEPGGGPFWIRDEAGKMSKQIIESSQIDMDDHEQEEIFQSSTHFNPVDLISYIRNHKGEKFNLSEFSDPSMAFISRKTRNGRELKALEHPGLWNGSMAGWLTWFVEVPLETFTPVKTVFDLMRPEHRI